MAAWYRKSIVRYGCCQSPNTPEPLELLGHDADEPLGVRAAGPAEIGRRHLALLRAELAVDFQLDGQAVAVVARDVGRVEAGHRPRLDDEVLEDLVEGGAEVNLPVGVGRTVVKHILRGAGPARPELPVQADLLPPGNRFRFGRLQVGLHREVGPRQVQRGFPVGHMNGQLYRRLVVSLRPSRARHSKPQTQRRTGTPDGVSVRLCVSASR